MTTQAGDSRAPSVKRLAASLVFVLIGVLFSLLLHGQAGAADDVNEYVAVTGVNRLPNPDYLTDHSGVVLNPNGSIFAVDNGEDEIIEYLPNGNGGWNVGRIFRVANAFSEPIDDLEDITWMGGNKYALIDEADNSLTVFLMPPSGTNLTEVYSVSLKTDVETQGPNGIEGLTYSFDDSDPDARIDTFYVVSERNALLVRIDIDTSLPGAPQVKDSPGIPLQVPFVSAIYDVQGEDTFYVLSNDARELYRFNRAGVQLGPPRSLGIDVPEGLTLSPDLSRMIIVGEAGGGNQIQEFAAPQVSTLQSVSQLTASSGDVHESGGVMSTASLTLPIGQSDGDYTGLRFNSLCVPSNAEIRSARLSFFSSGASNAPATMRIEAERSTSPASFDPSVLNNLGDRIPTANAVIDPNPNDWNGQYRSYAPDLSSVLNEVIQQDGWGECNPLVLRLSGTGLRNAASFDLNPLQAPALIVDYVEVDATSTPLGAEVIGSCFAGAGRVDVVMTNGFSTPVEATVSLSGLPDRITQVPAFGEATTTITGRVNGRYLATVTSGGSVTLSETVELTCQPPVTVRNFCLAQNGIFHIWTYNGSQQSQIVTVLVEGLAPRLQRVEPFERARTGVSGRVDGPYQIRVANQIGEFLFDETFEVDCDPPPPSGEVTVDVGCLSGDGLVETLLYNPTDETAEYTVAFDDLPIRSRVIGPGEVAKVGISGRPDGPHTLIARRDGVEVRKLTIVVSCD